MKTIKEIKENMRGSEKNLKSHKKTASSILTPDQQYNHDKTAVYYQAWINALKWVQE